MNTGVIWRDPQPQDDKADGQSRVCYEIITPDGQYDVFVPTDNEVQYGVYGDTSTCTNNGCSNSIDTQVNRMIALGKIPTNELTLLTTAGFIVDGKCNTSERYNAIMSGTSPQTGNSLYKPWDSARHDGMIPESLLPYPNQQRTPVFTVQDYFNAKITAGMKAAAVLWKSIFTIQYEIVPTDLPSLQKHLLHAPITIITGYCPGWETVSPIQACNLTNGHATLLYGYQQGSFLKDFDSYLPTNKKLAWDYKIGYAIKGVVILNNSLTYYNHFFNTELSEGMRGDEVKALQIALFLDDVFVDSEMTDRETIQKFGGYFGSATTDSVKKFQSKHGLPATGFVGPQTLSTLNLLYDI